VLAKKAIPRTSLPKTLRNSQGGLLEAPSHWGYYTDEDGASEAASGQAVLSEIPNLRASRTINGLESDVAVR
jgi:hypothetical protein